MNGLRPRQQMVLDFWWKSLIPAAQDVSFWTQSDKRWKRLYLGQGGELQFGDTTTNNWFGITEG